MKLENGKTKNCWDIIITTPTPRKSTMEWWMSKFQKLPGSVEGGGAPA